VKNLDIQKVIMPRFLKGDVTDPKRIEAKNNLLIHCCEIQKLSPNFEVNIRNQCTACNGRGFDLVLFDVTDTIPCKLVITINENGKTIYSGCNGTGWKIDACIKCNGTGKIGEIPCPTCINHKTGISRGTYQFHPTLPRDGNKGFAGKKCLVCKGTGKLKKIVQGSLNIKEAHICKKCSGSGTTTKIGTAVIDHQLGELLKMKCKTPSKKLDILNSSNC